MVASGVIHLSYPLAFLAGMISFLSPCVFPLLPAYVGYLGGRAGRTGSPIADRSTGGAVLATRSFDVMTVPILANGLAFVLGFSGIFVLAFYVLQALGSDAYTAHRHVIDVVAGVVVIGLGLNTLGLVRIGFLARDSRWVRMPARAGVLPSFLLGVTFAAGWTPCIGPQLAAILAVAEQGQFAGLPVMLAYCAGLAIPFLVAAALADRLQNGIRRVNRHLGVVSVIGGMLLIVFGLLLVSDSLTALNQFVPGAQWVEL